MQSADQVIGSTSRSSDIRRGSHSQRRGRDFRGGRGNSRGRGRGGGGRGFSRGGGGGRFSRGRGGGRGFSRARGEGTAFSRDRREGGDSKEGESGERRRGRSSFSRGRGGGRGFSRGHGGGDRSLSRDHKEGESRDVSRSGEDGGQGRGLSRGRGRGRGSRGLRGARGRSNIRSRGGVKRGFSSNREGDRTSSGDSSGSTFIKDKLQTESLDSTNSMDKGSKKKRNKQKPQDVMRKHLMTPQQTKTAIRITNLPKKVETSHEELQELISKHAGSVDLLFYNKATSLKMAIVSAICVLKDLTDVNRALENLHGQEFQGHHVLVQKFLSSIHDTHHVGKNCVFVSNLSEKTSEEDLWKLFESCGDIDFIHINRVVSSGTIEGALVHFKNSTCVPKALEQNGSKLLESVIKVVHLNWQFSVKLTNLERTTSCKELESFLEDHSPLYLSFSKGKKKKANKSALVFLTDQVGFQKALSLNGTEFKGSPIIVNSAAEDASDLKASPVKKEKSKKKTEKLKLVEIKTGSNSNAKKGERMERDEFGSDEDESDEDIEGEDNVIDDVMNGSSEEYEDAEVKEESNEDDSGEEDYDEEDNEEEESDENSEDGDDSEDQPIVTERKKLLIKGTDKATELASKSFSLQGKRKRKDSSDIQRKVSKKR